MSTADDKATANSVVDSINKNDWNMTAKAFDPNYVEHNAPPGFPAGIEGFKQFLSMFRATFPDFSYSIQDTIAEGDKVVQRVTGQGTMKGAFAGMPATGKHASWGEIHISRFKDGKIVEHWAVVDQVGMLQQLGLMPTPG